MSISNWVARRRERRRLKRERTGDSPEKLAERSRPAPDANPTDAMARTATVGFLGGWF
jgi:hypothetical protein